jgi:hypothetical protein
MVEVYTLFQGIISQTLKQKNKEFIMVEEKYTKVVLSLKMEVLFMALFEFNQENYQFLDHLEILKQRFLFIKEIQRFLLLSQR